MSLAFAAGDENERARQAVAVPVVGRPVSLAGHLNLEELYKVYLKVGADDVTFSTPHPPTANLAIEYVRKYVEKRVAERLLEMLSLGFPEVSKQKTGPFVREYVFAGLSVGKVAVTVLPYAVYRAP